jgi:hypothetical protein
MQFAQIRSGEPTELTGGTITSEDVQFSYETMLLWTPAERIAHSIYAVVEPTIPEGKQVSSSSLVFDGKKVSRKYTLIDTPPPPPPDEISDRQFAQGLASQGIITEDEALAWAGPGTIPAALLGFVSMLPEADQFAAKMLLTGAQVYKRSHPLTDTFATANGWTKEQADAFWLYCSSL